jgi:hypothetical protein
MRQAAAEDRRQLERCFAFEVELKRTACDLVEETELGTAFLSPSLPLVWDASWVLLERDDLEAPEVAALADRILGEGGFAHSVVIVPDPDRGARLRPGFEELEGWEPERGLYMVWRERPEREPEVDVAERRHAEIEQLRVTMIAGDLSLSGPRTAATVEQLIEWERRMGRGGGDRWFVAPAEGEAGSACRLFAAGGVGQVEDVGTLAAQRDRGLARAVTLAAARASAADGNGLTFLGALADDWPRLIYAKLGFEPVGELCLFRRRPR